MVSLRVCLYICFYRDLADRIVHSMSLLFGFKAIFNPIALRKAKIIYNFVLSECNRVKLPSRFKRVMEIPD